MLTTANNPASHVSGPGPLFTVAICTRNRSAFMAEAARSVLPQLRDDADLLIVDNCSADDTAALAAELAGSDSRVSVFCEQQLGLSAARNAALKEARGETVVFLDDDATAESGWLDAYRQFFGRPSSRNIAAAGGVVIPRYETSPPAWLDPRAHELRGSDRPHVFTRGGPWGCNFAVHRARAIEVGGFNPAYGRKGRSTAAHEETDLFQRLNRAGYQVWWVPEARIRHWVAKERLTLAVHCRNMFSLGRSTAVLRQQNVSGKLRRGYYLLARLALAPIHVVVCLLGGLVMMLAGQVRTAAKMVFRSIRIAGFACQLAREAMGR